MDDSLIFDISIFDTLSHSFARYGQVIKEKRTIVVYSHLFHNRTNTTRFVDVFHMNG